MAAAARHCRTAQPPASPTPSRLPEDLRWPRSGSGRADELKAGAESRGRSRSAGRRRADLRRAGSGRVEGKPGAARQTMADDVECRKNAAVTSAGDARASTMRRRSSGRSRRGPDRQAGPGLRAGRGSARAHRRRRCGSGTLGGAAMVSAAVAAAASGGLKKLADGLGAAVRGLDELTAGPGRCTGRALAGGIEKLYGRRRQLTGGLEQLQDGAGQLAPGWACWRRRRRARGGLGGTGQGRPAERRTRAHGVRRREVPRKPAFDGRSRAATGPVARAVRLGLLRALGDRRRPAADRNQATFAVNLERGGNAGRSRSSRSPRAGSRPRARRGPRRHER